MGRWLTDVSELQPLLLPGHTCHFTLQVRHCICALWCGIAVALQRGADYCWTSTVKLHAI